MKVFVKVLIKVLFYLTYAMRALRRGGQRTALALVCIAFGVMSLVSMQLIATNFSAAVFNDPRAEVGGDVQLGRHGRAISAAQLDEVAQWQAQGLIGSYTAFADAGMQVMSVAGNVAGSAAGDAAGNGSMYLLNRVLGVDPATYPLVGQITMREPQGVPVADLLKNAGDALVTRDLADKLGLKVGDRFALSARTGSTPVQFVITGIVKSTPEMRGDSVLYNLQSARKLAEWPDYITRISITWPNGSTPQARETQLQAWQAAGWSSMTVADVLNDSSRSQVTDVFGFMFKGAGILGLIVGGIGVATTLRVLLARRLLEIAMLKTLGYRKVDLISLFAIETFALGAAGGLIGALVAVVLSQQLTGLLARTGMMLFEYKADPTILIGGVLIGIVTSVVFGLHPIVTSSGISPVTLLRQLSDQPGLRNWRRRAGSIVLFTVLVVIFTAVCAVIMNSVLEGTAIVAGGIVAIVILGALLGGALSILVSIPWPRIKMMNLARTNLKRQRGVLIFPLLALFAGVFAIGFSMVTVASANDRVSGHQLPDTGDNLLVYARMQDETRVVAQAQQEGVSSIRVGYQLPVRAYGVAGNAIEGLETISGRTAADVASNLTLSGAPWSDTAQTVYLPHRFAESISVGQPITLVTASGVKRAVSVGGYYTVTRESALSLEAGGMLSTQRLVAGMDGEATSLTLTGVVAKDKLVATTDALRRAIPQAIVLNIIDLNDLFNRTLNNLFIFVVAVAALALVAGAVLIANAVGLSMLQRQREVGILKAVGFSSGDVLKTVVLENGLLGLLSGLFGIAGVAVAVAVLNVAQPAAHLRMDVSEVVVLVAVSAIIAGGIALAVAWQPTRVRPMEVLRAE